MSIAEAPEVSLGAAEDRVTAEEFKQLFRAVPAAVSIVAVSVDGAVHATTVSAFTSLSIDPPMVMLALDRRSSLLTLIKTHTVFTINVLGHDQAEQALLAAAKGPEKLPTVHWMAGGHGTRLVGSAAWATCRAERILDGGDHEIVLALVVNCAVASSSPLVYHDRTFHRLTAVVD